MDHLNGDLLCGIDVETTGLDPTKHDIYEITIIPVNGKYERDKTRPWFDLLIRPNKVSLIDWAGAGEKLKNKGRIENAIEKGIDSNTAMDLFEMWFEKQNLGTKRIAPIGHNYAFEDKFLREWLGNLNYESKFNTAQVRDTMSIARFCNDLCDLRHERFMYPKAHLQYLASELKVYRDYGPAHTALSDTAITIDVYRRMLDELSKKMLFA